MKAILNVHKESVYSKYNYLTFEVADYYFNSSNPNKSIITLNIDKGVNVDFTLSEVIIVDFDKEYQIQFDNLHWGISNTAKIYHILKSYAILHKVEFEPIYYCPS